MGAFQYCYFGTQNPRTFKLFIKISLAEVFEFVNKYIFPSLMII